MDGGYYETADQDPSGCGCGEQFSANDSSYLQGENAPYEYSAEAPAMNSSAFDEGGNDPRTFYATPQNGTSATPGAPTSGAAKPLPAAPPNRAGVPMPQDMTPMDPPMEFPKNSPGEFDPLDEKSAPAAEKVLDPVSFDLPRLPAIPLRSHSSVKRTVPRPVQPLATTSQHFQR